MQDTPPHTIPHKFVIAYESGCN